MSPVFDSGTRLSYREPQDNRNRGHRLSVSPRMQHHAGCKLFAISHIFVARRDSILSPQDMDMFEALVQDEDAFEKVFKEGLKESETIGMDYLLGNDQ